MRLRQKELASLIGTDQAHISRIENGEVTPSDEALTEIAHQLDMTLSQLTGKMGLFLNIAKLIACRE